MYYIQNTFLCLSGHFFQQTLTSKINNLAESILLLGIEIMLLTKAI